MTLDLPKHFLFENSKLRIKYEDKLQLNKTSSAIVISGSRGGFLSLANALIYLIYDMKEKIALHQIPYIDSSIDFTLVLDDSHDIPESGVIKRISSHNFEWRIGETNAIVFAATVHSLGEQNSEIHIDDKKSYDDISVYCVVDD